MRLFAVCIALLSLALSACGGTGGGGSATPPWALGEQPNFSGVIVDWAKGDAIAAAESALYGTFYPSSDPDGDGIDLGLGHIDANGSFTFGLERLSSTYPWLESSVVPGCAGLSVSNPQLRTARADELEVPDLYEEGKHARPGGGVLILSEPFDPSDHERHLFIYASADGTVKGSCSQEGFAITVDLDLRHGWNSYRLGISPSGMSAKTAAIPQTARWYFINPLTITVD